LSRHIDDEYFHPGVPSAELKFSRAIHFREK
jgi:hypothetical protein